MDGLIVDSSVWINFLSGSKSVGVNSLKEHIETDRLFICPIIIQEVLQGVRDDRKYAQLLDGLSAIPMLQADMWDASVGAADIYRKLRKSGITIRKPNDCLIAWYAIAYDLPLLHDDRDFEFISSHSPLKIFKP